MRLEELDFPIPEELIAQEPLEPRDSCRLLRLTPDGRREHRVFSGLAEILRPGDTLVFNDSRVLPARIEAHRATGGRVELLFLRPVGTAEGASERWEALARPSHRLKEGETVVLEGDDAIVLSRRVDEGRWLVESAGRSSLLALMERYGRLPLPPYIKKYPTDPSSYQTVYAVAPGSAAAPTAGLHFTPGLLERLRRRGVGETFVTLHVGLDTFQPIREENVEDHKIHREAFSVSADALACLRSARAQGQRLVAVGTTATRVLETLAGLHLLDEAPAEVASGGQDWPSLAPCAGPLAAASAAPAGPPGAAPPQAAATGAEVASALATGDGGVAGSTQIYITPGYRFRAVDALITNFHLPHSTVLALTMAFVGVDGLREAYAEAVAMRYRFFSFGDAMLAEGRDADV
jgi:S-adenosylmethionine:tRNA ribosyltransferase-isomerase